MNGERDGNASTRAGRDLVLSIVPPLVALAVQLALWPYLAPSTWFLFYPAAFLSAWIGGVRGALVAVAIASVACLWFFLPPERSFVKPPGLYLQPLLFAATGLAFGVVHDRLNDERRRRALALAETQRANERLRRALEERGIFAALVENSPDFIGIADPDGRPRYVNRAGRRMVGLADDHPVEETRIPDYYPDDQRALASEVIVPSMIAKGHWEGETAFRHWRTGESIPVSDTHFMIREPETGQVLGMGTITRDVSELRRTRDDAVRARRELERANEEIRSLIEQAPDAILVADADGRCAEVNGAASCLLGRAREEILGAAVLDFVSPAERLRDAMPELSPGGTVSADGLLLRDDGKHVPVEIRATVLRDGRWQLFVRDVSRRKQLEEALRASHADLARAQSVAKVGSWRLDVRKNELHWSEESYRVFGVAPGSPMTYEGFLACVHPDDRAYVDREWKAALAGAPYDIEHRVVTNGVTKWVREKADLEFDEAGVLLGGIGISQDVTERWRREEELREARERFELALRGADLGAWDWNVATGEVVFNARWAEMRGYAPGDVAHDIDAWRAGIHPEDWPRVQAALAEHFVGGAPEFDIEYRVRTKAGGWIWVLDRGKVFARDARGEPTRMVGTELDVTARKRAEEELRLAEARASGILAISADAIVNVDVEQRIRAFNEGAEKIFGYAKAEVIGAPLEILFPERFRDAHRQHVARFAAGRPGARRMGQRGAAVFGRRKTGEEFPADAAISCLDVEGTRVLTVAVRDVTEERRIEREQTFLAEVGSILATTLELDATITSIGRLATRSFADLCIVYVVEGGELRRLNAVARDPVLAWACEVLERSPLDRSRAREVWSALEENRSVLLEELSPERLAEFAQSDEHLRALRALAPRSSILAPLFAHGRFVGALSFSTSAPGRAYGARDVRLAEQVAQRAALAIVNAQLYAEARRAIRTRDDFLGVVAHDLRNPLGIILLQAGSLRRPDAEARSLRRVDAIERSANRMNRLIQDLLDVARMEAGGLSVEPARLGVRQVLSEVVDAQAPLAAAVSLELRVEPADDLPDVLADRDRLLQVFENLIGNAIKFTEPGGLITVGATLSGDDVRFRVADTGPGIPSEDLPRVFERFWQSRRSGRRGAGLGLTIVKGIVEAHGGRAWVESAPGRGTTFFFTMPTAREAERRAAA